MYFMPGSEESLLLASLLFLPCFQPATSSAYYQCFSLVFFFLDQSSAQLPDALLDAINAFPQAAL